MRLALEVSLHHRAAALLQDGLLLALAPQGEGRAIPQDSLKESCSTPSMFSYGIPV